MRFFRRELSVYVGDDNTAELLFHLTPKASAAELSAFDVTLAELVAAHGADAERIARNMHDFRRRRPASAAGTITIEHAADCPAAAAAPPCETRPARERCTHDRVLFERRGHRCRPCHCDFAQRIIAELTR